MKYRVMSWIPVEPDDEVASTTDVLDEAIADLHQAMDMQPENKYEVQRQNEDGEWERVPAYIFAGRE